MRSIWSLIRAFVRLQSPVTRKQSTMSSLPAVSVHERSPSMNLFSYNFRRFSRRRRSALRGWSRARQRTGYAMPFATINGIGINYLIQGSWALKELMPQSELWDVLPPQQTGQNTLEQILRFKSRFETSAQA